MNKIYRLRAGIQRTNLKQKTGLIQTAITTQSSLAFDINFCQIFCQTFTTSILKSVKLVIHLISDIFRASGQYPMAMTLLSESVPMSKRNLVVLLVASIFLLSQGIMSGTKILLIFLKLGIRISNDVFWNPGHILYSFFFQSWLYQSFHLPSPMSYLVQVSTGTPGGLYFQYTQLPVLYVQCAYFSCAKVRSFFSLRVGRLKQQLF